MNDLIKEKLKKCLQLVSEPNASLKDLEKVNSIEKKINSEFSDEEKQKAIKENAEIINQISFKSKEIVNEFIDKWKERKVHPEVEDLKIIEKFLNDINEGIESMIFSICRVIYNEESIEKQKNIENQRDKDKELRNEIIALLFKHEKERLQSNQTNQSISSSSKVQNQPSDKNNYPWGIIIGMGVAIVALLGTIIFLLTKIKK